jgi:hypothetical protein
LGAAVKLLMGRKFIVAVLSLVTAFVLALLGKLTGDFAFIASVVNGAFAAADAAITRKSFDAGSTSTGREPAGEQ